MQVIRKITIKTCGDFSIKRIKEVMEAAQLEEGQSLPLLKIVGECNGAKSGQTDKGEFTKLTGNFVGTDMTTGELYQSAVCILPEFVGAALGAAALQSGSVRFAFEIGAKRKDNAITGYEFTVKPLIETKPTDAVLELMALAGIEAPKVQALAAPASAKPEKVKEKAKETAAAK
jgi:hypothetical protein